MKRRVISWFSCGVASAVATKLAILEYANNSDFEFVIARCFIKEEHEDNERFSEECSKWFGLPITILTNEEYSGSVDEVIRKTNYISGISGAPCSLKLKKRVREGFQLPTDRHVFGYTNDKEDINRWDRLLDANNIDAVAPLIDAKLTHSNCLALIQKAGIDIPIMYKLGYKHNNCKGCVKATGGGIGIKSV